VSPERFAHTTEEGSVGALNEAAREWQTTDKSVAQNNAGQYFSDYFRLMQYYKKPAE